MLKVLIMVEFESILPYIDRIETLLNQKKSPQKIAAELGIPEKWMTITRYKKKYFDTTKAASLAWMGEQQKPHEQRFEEGKAEIIDSLELLNLAKKRARELMNLNVGDPYTTAEGEARNVSYGVAAIYWPAGQKMACDAIRQEQEIAGDDPESKKADALQEWADTRLAILEAVDDDPEAKAAIIQALEQRRRPAVCP